MTPLTNVQRASEQPPGNGVCLYIPRVMSQSEEMRISLSCSFFSLSDLFIADSSVNHFLQLVNDSIFVIRTFETFLTTFSCVMDQHVPLLKLLNESSLHFDC